jgi:predicted ATPase
MALIGRICRQLYGIPLAIQLAAPRTSVFGVEGLAGRLSEHFQRITGEDGNTLVLADTVRATLDWSYELLPATERAVLRRLSLFRAGFTLGSATAIVAGGDVADADVLDYVTNLVAKSLIASYSVRGVMAYGLLDTIRAYAAQKLHESGELQEFSRRYAEYHSVCGAVRVPTAEQAEFTRFTTPFVNP